MQFNVRNFNENGWPGLFNAVRNEDWLKAAKESHRDETGSPGMIERNRLTKEKFLDALAEKNKK